MSERKGIQGDATGGRYSKRKKAPVDYREDAFDDEETEAEADETDFVVGSQALEPHLSKKRNIGPAAQPRPPPKQQTFAFLKLSGELRNMIYQYTLQSVNPIYLKAVRTKFRNKTVQTDAYWKRPVDSHLVPALLVVNRQICHEGRGLLYRNKLQFETAFALHTFISNIGPHAASLLEDVTLSSYGENAPYNHPAFSIMASATNLTNLTLGPVGIYGSQETLARRFYRDCHHWIEAVGVAKGKADAAVDIVNVVPAGVFPNLQDFQTFKAELRRLLNIHAKEMKRKRVESKKKGRKSV